MEPFPHLYSVEAVGSADGHVDVDSAGLPQLQSAPPPQFGGPGGQWSPESLLAAAAASCFILTFRAIARASHLNWTRLEAKVDATLDRVDGVTRFTRIVTRAALTVPAGTSTVSCERALTKAEAGCLIANSLRGERELQMEIIKSTDAESELQLAQSS
ncbi:MAG TPA: OsmC family protein [Steroidobacter sp.]|uniref:OsmC family protein n=1 Tax=Steroidobacter sp. TaxID=1978227 RepID=UPI002ED8753A